MMNDDLTHLYSLASVYKSDTMLYTRLQYNKYFCE